MAADRQTKISSSLPVIAVLAIIAGVVYFSRSPLKSLRPEAPPGLREPVPEKDKIEARLWQDPLKVALDHEKAMHCGMKGEDGSPRRECSSKHCVDQITDRISKILRENHDDPNDPNTILHVLLTIIRDGTFAEDHERRLRNRYAVLTALGASGLAPEDSKHIQYFTLPWRERNELEKNIREKKVPKIDTVHNKNSKPLVVPFEWFETETLYSAAREGHRPKHVLVVWLARSAFSNQPLTHLAHVIDKLGLVKNSHDNNSSCCACTSESENRAIKPEKKKIRIDVIGPSRSTTLRKMLEEVVDLLGPSKSTTLRTKLEETKKMITEIKQNRKNDPNLVNAGHKLKDCVKAGSLRELGNLRKKLEKLKKLSGVTVFSPWSTASPALLVKDWDKQDPNQNSLLRLYEVIPKEFARVDVEFFRMIGSDDLLVLHLIRELSRRGVDVIKKKDHVALISEWDTFYGKAFPLTFATMMASIDPNDPNFPDNEPNWINYAQNLNKKMPRGDKHFFPENLRTYSYIRGIDGRLPESEAPKEKQTNRDTEAESKWTYAKSLELPIGRGQLDYVRRLAQKLSDKYKLKRRKLRAIGVVGSDVYDKLILLHALREQFDDVIFFMTDLDARLMQH